MNRGDGVDGIDKLPLLVPHVQFLQSQSIVRISDRELVTIDNSNQSRDDTSSRPRSLGPLVLYYCFDQKSERPVPRGKPRYDKDPCVEDPWNGVRHGRMRTGPTIRTSPVLENPVSGTLNFPKLPYSNRSHS